MNKNTHKLLSCLNCATNFTRSDRFVWGQQNVPATGPAENIEGSFSIGDMMKGLARTAKTDVQNIIGETIDPAMLRGNPDAQQNVIEKLFTAAEDLGKSYDEMMSRLNLLFGRTVYDEEVSYLTHDNVVQKEMDEQEEEKKAPQGTVQIQENRTVLKRNWDRAKLASDTLNKQEKQAKEKGEFSWKEFVDKSSAFRGFPAPVFMAFIQMESDWNPKDAPVYKDLNTGKNIHIHAFLTDEEQKAKNVKLISSAHGLAQAMFKEVPTYIKDPNGYRAFLAYRKTYGSNSPMPDPNDPKLQEKLMYYPEVAIDYMGYHLQEKIDSVNSIIDHPEHVSPKDQKRHGIRAGEFPESYKLSPKSDMKWLYLAYNSGQVGYLVMRRYLDSKTDADRTRNITYFAGFQQKEKKQADGTTKLDGFVRLDYSERVAQVTAACADRLET